GDRLHRQLAAGLERRQTEALHQPQRVEHELERPLLRCNVLLAADRRRTAGRRLPGGRMPGLPAPQDLLRRAQGEFAVRVGADSEVVAVAPVVEVVRALATGPR